MLLATGMVAALHWSNDGLWFQGDAPRHAVNGLFLWDYLAALPENPLDYAVRYYARYPVIAPLVYPPLFYLIEGAAFWLIAPSPYVAKSIVLAFAALAGLYTMAWTRRWAGSWAGWAGACIVLLPGFVRYSNAVLLNVPATAFTIAGLYHLVVWLETGQQTHRRWFGVLTAVAFLTYYPSAIALPVALVWILLSGGWRRSRWLWLLPMTIAVLAVVMAVALPQYWDRNAPEIGRLWRVSLWSFYWRQLLALVSPMWIAFGLIGLLLGGIGSRRRESLWLALAISTVIVCLILLPAESDRYALMLVPMLVIAAFLGAGSAAVPERLRPVLPVALIATAGWSAATTRVQVVSGFEGVAAYVRQHGPDDTVLYSGFHDGVFGFYLRAGDPGFRQRMVVAQKVLARYEQDRLFVWRETPYVSTVADVVPLLERSCGCRWIAVERGSADMTVSESLLRQVLDGPDFERVTSFTIASRMTSRVDLYRFLHPVEPAPAIDLVFPSFNRRIFRNVEPVRR
jgi:hypothetical protein